MRLAPWSRRTSTRAISRVVTRLNRITGGSAIIESLPWYGAVVIRIPIRRIIVRIRIRIAPTPVVGITKCVPIRRVIPIRIITVVKRIRSNSGAVSSTKRWGARNFPLVGPGWARARLRTQRISQILADRQKSGDHQQLSGWSPEALPSHPPCFPLSRILVCRYMWCAFER